MYGNDKIPNDERAAFVEEHEEQIRESAASPLYGKRWWLGADKPWQVAYQLIANYVHSHALHSSVLLLLRIMYLH